MELLIPISNIYISFINFVIFDVFLITFIFHFTTDISARLNHLSLLNGATKPLIVVSPPLLGGGLCSTNRLRAWIMLALRILAVSLIFGANFTIDGGNREVEGVRSAQIRIPGPLPANITREQLEDAVLDSMSCRVTKGGFIYFGRLYVEGYCEYNTDVLMDQVRIASKPVRKQFSIPGCVRSLFQAETGTLEYVTFNCSQRSSVIQCRIPNNQEFEASRCGGIVRSLDGTYFVCDEFESREEDTWVGLCRKSHNLHRVRNYWAQARSNSYASLIDIIGGTSVMLQEKQRIKYKKRKNVTLLSKLWFVFFVSKLGLLVALIIASYKLKAKGARSILHDEHALMYLLRLNISRDYGLANDDWKLYLHFSRESSTRKPAIWASCTPQMRPTNVAIDSVEQLNY